MTKISIVIPAHNEADNIGTLISEIKQLKLNYPYEIIIVDDNSSDDTYTNTVKMKTAVPELKII
jgi:dolichol-phosphate mannosyltransferase